MSAAGRGLAAWALCIGALLGTVLFAPAAWLSQAVAQGTQGRVQLEDAHGTIWSGSAVLVLTGGQGSGDARQLPRRLQWSFNPAWLEGRPALALRLQQPCCLPDGTRLSWTPGWSDAALRVDTAPGQAAELPAALLAGLGTPWNTLQPSGIVRLLPQALRMRQADGPWQLEGQLRIELRQIASRVSTLPRLGDYDIVLQGGPTVTVSLQSSPDSALQLEGQGQWTASQGLRFRGEARAAAGQEAALGNLLNIIGRREGARSVVSIG